MEIQTPAWVIDALALIQGKYDICGRKYTDAAEDLYVNVLSRMDNVYGPQAVSLCLLEAARVPDISDLSYKHACLISPAPDWEDAWREVSQKMGAAGKQVISHPAVREAVTDMGGLDSLWHSYRFEGTALSILRAQFQKIYEAGVKARRLQVVELIARMGLPAAREAYPQLLPAPGAVVALEAAARARYQELPENGRTLRLAGEEHTARMKRIEAQPLAPNVAEYIRGIRRRANLGAKGGPFVENGLQAIGEI